MGDTESTSDDLRRSRADPPGGSASFDTLAADLASAIDYVVGCRFVGLRTAEGWAGVRNDELVGQIEPHVPGWETDVEVVSIPGGTLAVVLPLAGASGEVAAIVATEASELPPAQLTLLRSLTLVTRMSRTAALPVTRGDERSVELVAGGNVDRATEVLRLLRAAARRLTDAVSAGRGFDGIAGVVHDVTGAPTAIWSDDGRVLAEVPQDTARPSPAPPTVPRTDEVVHVNGWTCRSFAFGERSSVTLGVRDEGAGVEVADIAVAVLLEQGASAAALELYRRRSVTEAEVGMWRELALELLFGHDGHRARAHAEALGHNLADSHRVALIDADVPIAQLASIARATVSVLGGTPLVTRYRREMALIMPSDGDLAAFAATVDRAVGTAWKAGVSQPIAGLQLGDALREAEAALGIASQIGASGVVKFEDLGVHRLLLARGDSDELDRFVQRWLGAVLDHDRRRHSRLLESLSEYLEQGGSLDRAATSLSVHRSTVKYRLDRIAALLDVDLQDADVRFNLMLAIRVVTTERALHRGRWE